MLPANLFDLYRLTSLRYILLLVVALLTVEAALTEHALEHSFGEDEDVCLSCDKANNFHSALISAVITALIPSAFVESRNAYSILHLLNLAAGYFARAPPCMIPNPISHKVAPLNQYFA